MTALHPGRTGAALAALAERLPKPDAIVVATAHWLTRRPAVGAAAQPATVHDFGGFPQDLYRMQYPAAGQPELARQIQQLLVDAGLPADLDPARGLDHGVWVPLRMLYPDASIPVVPMAIQPQEGPAWHVALGRALAPLRDHNVLVIGSGSITHNLHDLRAGYSNDREAPYVRPFVDWMEDALLRDDLDALLDYRRKAPFSERAHPSDEHLLPLYVAMGASGDAPWHARRIDAGIDLGLLAMDIYRFGLAEHTVDHPVPMHH
jgi:4,5-DOPA dioxygenase extradiol